MSIRTLLNKNNFNIYVNEINLKNLNLSSDGNYKLKLPPIVPTGTEPLSVLAVDSIVGDLITLKWLEPSESLPFDVINCNILNAEQEINCPDGVTTLGYMECNICNIKKIGGTEITGFLTSPLQTENNIAYVLPPSRPTQDGQVLSSQINGILSWINKDTSNFIPRSYFIQLPDVILNSSTPNQSLNFDYNLIEADAYSCIFGGRVVKLNPTGSFNFRAIAVNLGSVNIGIRPFIALPNGGFTNLNSSNIDCGINLSFFFQATATGNNRIRCELESDITGAGECLIQDISMLITKLAF